MFFTGTGAGLLSKIDYVRNLIFTNDVDIFFIAESEIKSEFDIGCLTIPGYDLICARTIETRNKARLICFAKHRYEVKEIGSDLNDLVTLVTGDFVIIGLYRGFKCFEQETELSNLTRILDTIAGVEKNKKLIAIGDFNIDIGRSNAKFYEYLHNWVDTRALSICSVGITRSRWVNDQLQESALDFVISNNDNFNLTKE